MRLEEEIRRQKPKVILKAKVLSENNEVILNQTAGFCIHEDFQEKRKGQNFPHERD